MDFLPVTDAAGTEVDDAPHFASYEIFLDSGKNAFSLKVGTEDDLQDVLVNLTFSIDGIALPSPMISPGEDTYYAITT